MRSIMRSLRKRIFMQCISLKDAKDFLVTTVPQFTTKNPIQMFIESRGKPVIQFNDLA